MKCGDPSTFVPTGQTWKLVSISAVPAKMFRNSGITMIWSKVTPLLTMKNIRNFESSGCLSL